MEISLSRKESWKRSLISCWRFISFRKARSRKGGSVWRLELSLQRLLCFGFFFAVFLYALAVVGLYSWRTTVPYNQVRLTDIAFPWQWPAMKERLSMTNLRQAEHNLEEKNYRQAFLEVSASVNRYPANFEARILLARLLAGGDPERALRTLQVGYRVGTPKDEAYNSLFLALALRLENFEALNEVLPILIGQLHKEPASEANTRRIESYYVVLLQAQMKLSNYVAALRTLDQIEQQKMNIQTLPIRLLLLTRMGSFSEFDRLVASLPLRERDSAAILMLRAQAAYERGEADVAQTFVGRALAGSQQNWATYMDGIKLLLRMGQVRKAEEYVDLYLYYNGNNRQAVQRLAAAMTDWPSSYLVSKIKLWALASNAQMYPMLLFYEIQAMFREGRFLEARELFDNWVQYVPQGHADYRYVQAYESLFNAVLADSEANRQQLLDMLQKQVTDGNPYPEEVYWVAADAMRKMNRYELADTIINQGMSVYPNTLTLGKLRRQMREERLGGSRLQSNTRRSNTGGWDTEIDTSLAAEALKNGAATEQAPSVIFNTEVLETEN